MAKVNSINQGQLELIYHPVKQRVSVSLILKRVFVLLFRSRHNDHLAGTDQWKIDREQAITERILNSKKVEIVEQFNSALDASAGMHQKDSSLGVGAQYSNKHLASRRIVFSGHRKNPPALHAGGAQGESGVD